MSHHFEAIFVDGQRYINDGILGSVKHLKERGLEIIETKPDPNEALGQLFRLIDMLPTGKDYYDNQC